VFLRALGVVYLVAFGSLLPQISGLWGSKGILPAAEFFHGAREALGAKAYWLFPSLGWLGASDGALKVICLLGILFSLILIFDVHPTFSVVSLPALWAFYLSLYYAGQDFMSFQWDILLLEAGFLAIFLPFSPELVRWLFLWLLFRLMFLSGAVKLLSGDSSWRDLTALTYHYFTQPLPNVLSWFAHQLPAWFHKVSQALMFVVELAVPFAFFAGRQLRLWAAGLVVGLQVFIFFTGNYNFFNVLTAALCLFLLDDEVFASFLPLWIQERAAAASFGDVGAWLGQYAVPVAALFLLVVTATLFLGRFVSLPQPARQLLAAVQPFHIANNYGLFAVMTKMRPEIVIEGSNDGKEWREYEFKWKPGDVQRAPGWVAPHQPRLDWQMWFAALSDYRSNPWFMNFLARLLDGSPDVLGLIAKNPFPAAPPKHIRAQLYDYRFATPAERNASGDWWKRSLIGPYTPEISLR
jgi:hypothetical protein